MRVFISLNELLTYIAITTPLVLFAYLAFGRRDWGGYYFDGNDYPIEGSLAQKIMQGNKEAGSVDHETISE